MRRKVKKRLIVVGVFLAAVLLVCLGAFGSWLVLRPSSEKNPRVTVLMSTYNRGTTLGPSIESILAQTYTDFEFIIINDGSTDKTAEILKWYALRDPRVIVLTNRKNKGLIYSLNRGIDKARGEYIMRMDDDDYSAPFRMERQVQAMDEHPEIVVMGASVIPVKTPISKLEKKEGSPEVYDPNEIELNSYFGPGVAHPTVMMRKDFLNKHNLRYPEYLYAEDVGLWKNILEKGGKVSAMAEGVMFYRTLDLLPSPRSDDYFEVQQQSWRQVQKEKLLRFFPVTRKDLFAADNNLGRCKILKKMVEVNKTKKLVNQKGLEKYFGDNCTADFENAQFVKHPYWESMVSVKGDRFERNEQEGGDIVARKGDTITVKWDHWDAEVFKKTKDGYEYLRDKDGTVKKKKK